jgi:hypothetical protein
LYLNEQIVKANGTRRSDAEITPHIINVASKYYNIPRNSFLKGRIRKSRRKLQGRNY